MVALKDWRLLAAMFVLFGVACVSSDDAAREAPAGTVSGTITYDGAAGATGRPLSIALYRSYPPNGPPVRALLLETYEFPYHFTFERLPAGVYVVAALIDLDRMDTRYAGMLNARRDPHDYFAGGLPIEIDGLAGAAGIDLALRDP